MPTLVEIRCDKLADGGQYLEYYWSDGSRDLWTGTKPNQLCVLLPEDGKRYSFRPPPIPGVGTTTTP